MTIPPSTYTLWHDAWLTANRERFRWFELQTYLQELCDPKGVYHLMGWSPEKIGIERAWAEAEIERMGGEPPWVEVAWPDPVGAFPEHVVK